MDGHLAKPIRIELLAEALAGTADPGEPLDSPTDEHPVARRLRSFATGDDHELAREFHALYERDAPGHLASLRAAAATHDFDGLWSSAHTLKGTAANLGADEMAHTCRLIEEHAKARELGEIEGLLAQLEERAADLGSVLARLARGS